MGEADTGRGNRLHRMDAGREPAPFRIRRDAHGQERSRGRSRASRAIPGTGGAMKIDAYTKAVLTVIAACLVWMCVNGATPTTHAQAKPPEPMPVVLVDASGAPGGTLPCTARDP